MGLREETQAFEARLIVKALAQRDGNATHAAMDLGMVPSTLTRKIHALGLGDHCQGPGWPHNQKPWTHNPRSVNFWKAVQAFQAKLIRSTLKRRHGNVAEAARDLGITPSTLWRRVKSLKLGQWVKRLRALALMDSAMKGER